MQSLRNIQHSAVKFKAGLPLSATAWDVSTNALICAFGPTQELPLVELKRLTSQVDAETSPGKGLQDNNLKDIASWDALPPTPELTADSILKIHFFSEDLVTCLVFIGGDIVLAREEPLPGEDRIEIVGSVDAGIRQAEWSPDEELLAIATGADTILFMSRQFENTATFHLKNEDLQTSQHVSVGWGKAETQFRGKRAKAARDPTVPEKFEQGTLSPNDDGKVSMSWRGDGMYLAISSVHDGSRRVIRVLSREGVLDSVSEPVDGLQGALSWRPSGNIIASVQEKDGEINVVFFERNGLRHGQFNLRVAPTMRQQGSIPIGLKWNIDSSALAVLYQDKTQLWTMSNYYYYLSQEMTMPSTGLNSSALSLEWHPERPFEFSLSSSDTVKRVEYTSLSIEGGATPPYDYGLTAVIDGDHVQLSPLRIANVPPPMALHEIALDSSVVDVAISQSNTQIAMLQHKKISFFECIYKVKKMSQPELVCQMNLPDKDDWSHFQQLCWVGNSNLFVLQSHGSSSTVHFYVLRLKELKLIHSVQFPYGIANIFPSTDHKALCICHAKTVVEVQLGDGVADLEELEPRHFSEVVTFPAKVPRIEVLHLDNETIAVGLSRSGALYANQRLLVKNCTSFTSTTAHLIFTTGQHLLKFVHLAAIDDMEVPPDDPERDERCRSIERGAKIVTVIPSGFSVILQMPRGNLETIYPRALVVAGIRKSIASKDYHTAFFACRNQKVDMNILHDYAPQQFLQDIALFIDQIEKVEHIDLFLSQLREENVSETMYKETLSSPKSPQVEKRTSQSDANTSKVNLICDAFLNVLQQRLSTNLQNVITAHTCKSPPDLRAGLGMIAELRRNNMESAELAIEHICFLADTNKLYNEALGLYDLELALMIAQQAQMDPREYLPFLSELQALPDLRKAFAIDDHLGRYSKALKHLHAMGLLAEAKAYTVKHELYTAALDLYKYDKAGHDELLKLYADHLHDRSRFKEAGICYEHILDYVSACDCYRLAQAWQECLTCAQLAKFPHSKIAEIARSLADALQETKEYHSAADIQLDYLVDVSAATKLYCRGYHFEEAMRVVALHNRRDLLESVIDSGLAEGLANMTELLSECKGQIGAQVPRLRELRVKKTEEPLTYFEGTTSADIPDNISLAPTDTTAGGTLFTRYTNRTGTVNTATTRKTSKNRRREERKRARGKKGTVYEEGYLVNSITRLIERVNSVGDEVRRLVEGLMRRGMRERATAVEGAMIEVIKLCQDCVSEVYEIDDRQTQDQHQNGEAIYETTEHARPPGADGVYWESMEETGKKKEPPVIKAFQRLSILDV